MSTADRIDVALVTGAAGFVGSRLVRRLVAEGARVHALCRATSDTWRLRELYEQVTVHHADLLDAESLRAVVRAARPSHVFHLAAAAMVGGASAAAADLLSVNLLGTINLIDACEAVDYRGLVSTGDAFEYGPTVGPLRESGACRPDTLMGITKLGATLHAAAVARERGRPIVTLRPFSTYGPDDHPRRLVPKVVAGALAGTPIALSRPEIARDWVFVEDLVELYVEAARTPGAMGQVFNAGSGREVDIAGIVDTVRRITETRAELRWGAFPAAPHDAHRWVADMRRTFERFRWRPRTSLEDGLRATIAATARRGETAATAGRP
jgi:nucleoside-diphosphate-sugar epimerase